jgi:glycosyltransferase 2 family protein
MSTVPAARSRKRSLITYALSIVITGLFLYLAFRGTDFHELLLSMRQANYWWMIPYFAALMVSHALRSWRWRYMLEPVKPGIALRNLFSGVMVGYMMNNILPRAGELVRPYAIGKLEGIPKSAAFGTIVVERLLDTLSFVILVVSIPLLYRGPLKESFPWLESTGIIVTAATGGMLAFLIVLMLRRNWTDAPLGIVRKMVSPELGSRIEKGVHSFLDGFVFLKRPDRFLIIFILSILVWALYAVMMYAAFFAFDLQYLGFRSAIVVLAISSIGVAIPTPGGTGTYHVLTSQTLSRLYAVHATTALSYATVTHAVGFIGVTLIGLYYFLHDHIRVSEAVKNGEGEGS